MPDRLPWYVAGPILGLLIVAMRAALNKPFGALGGYVDLGGALRAPSIGPRAFVVLGLVLGGAAYAALSGAFAPTLAYEGSVAATGSAALLPLLAGAGVVMGVGARTAGGCTSGHGMSGMSLMSPASIAASMTFFAVAVGIAHAFVLLGGAP